MTMRFTRAAAVAALAFITAGAAAAGCKTTNTVSRKQPEYSADVVDDKRVSTDHFLSNKARVLEVRQSTVSGDIMKVQVELLNNTRWGGQVNHKFEWFDEQGMIVNAPSSTWKPVMLAAKETISLVGVAPNPRCKDFRLKLMRSSGK